VCRIRTESQRLSSTLAVVIYELRQRNLSCSFWDDLWDALRQKKKWYPLKTTRGAVCYYTVWRR